MIWAWAIDTLTAVARGLARAATGNQREIPAWPPRDHDQAAGCSCAWRDEFLVETLDAGCPLVEHRAALEVERTVGLA